LYPQKVTLPESHFPGRHGGLVAPGCLPDHGCRPIHGGKGSTRQAARQLLHEQAGPAPNSSSGHPVAGPLTPAAQANRSRFSWHR
jgi:hypothetical protein